MSDWIPVQDPTTGRTYYANLKTKATSWTPPPGFKGDAVPQVVYTPSQMNFGVSQSSFSQSSVSIDEQSVNNVNKQPPPFANKKVPPVNPFQSNRNMNSNSNFPPQLPNQQQAPSMSNFSSQSSSYLSPQSSSSSKWKKANDPKTGRDYWYHTDTKETTWTMPPDFDGQQGSGTAKRLSAQMAVVGMSESETQIQTQAWESSGDDDGDEEQKQQKHKQNKDEDSWNDDEKEESESSKDEDGLEAYDKQKVAAPIKSNVRDDVTDSEEEEHVQNIGDGDDGDITVQDSQNKYWNLGETKGDQFRLEGYGELHFQKEKHKKGILKKYSISELLEWTAYKNLQNALKKLDSKLNNQAKQIWKNITSYMGDRKSGKKQEGHIDKLLRFALKAPEELRDEIFCQLCKQTNKNPKQESLLRGWKLMCVCCSVFPPSDEFASYLASYLFGRTKEPGEVGEYATYALQALDRTMEVGQRRVQPLPYEVQRIEERQRIPVKIYYVDGTFRTLLLSTQSRASEVSKSLAESLKLNHPESFGLFEMEEPHPDFEDKAYEKREEMDNQAKIDDLQHMPYDRELEMNERVLDVMASWTRGKKKKQRKINLTYKCKIFSKAQENSYTRNEWKIEFQSAIWNICHGYYLIESEEQAFLLAGLQLQAIHGVQNDDYYTTGVASEPIKYLPWTIARKYRPDDAENRILAAHKTYKHLDKVDAYRKYIELLRKSDMTNKYFGNVFFRCVRVSRLKKQTKKEQDDLLIGISENGVIFIQPRTKEILERYKMEEILTYGFRSNAFLFVAGTLMTQKKYQFATMLGKQMNDLLRAHIDLRVQQAEIQGYQIPNR